MVINWPRLGLSLFTGEEMTMREYVKAERKPVCQDRAEKAVDWEG